MRNPVITCILRYTPVAYPMFNRLTIRCDATNYVCASRIMADGTTASVHVYDPSFRFHSREDSSATDRLTADLLYD